MKTFLSVYFLLAAMAAQATVLESYNVIWDSPSMDSLDSMPLSGRSGAGANVWVQDGSLWLYLGHSGAFDEQGRLLKLGCIRITPVGLKLGESGFRQELDLPSGAITIRQGDFKADLWFAGETLVFESESGTEGALEIAFGSWRDRKREGIRQDMFDGRGTFMPDRITADADGFLWFHRNADYAGDVVGMARAQGISDEAVHDATTKRVFGAAVRVDGGISNPVETGVQWQFWEGKAWTGRTSIRTRHTLAMRLGAAINADPDQWCAEAKAALVPDFRKKAKKDELKRWAEFWSRSHVFISQQPKTHNQQPDAFLVGRNYQLFRYMLACNRDGELPLLFNGGIFTTDNKPGRITGNNNNELPLSEGGPITPDFRRWMACRFMSQNQRWMGWPTLADGDADLLAPSLAFYRDRAATAAARARTLGAEGVVYPEPLDIWGLCCVAPRPDGLCGAPHLTYHFSMMLEHAWMALQAHDSLGGDITNDLPWIEGAVLFYDSFYRAENKRRTGQELGGDGKLVIYPSNGLEYACGATDPIEVVCALRRITKSLLRLPTLSDESRARFRKIEPTLPGLPTGVRQGRPVLLEAKSFEKVYNIWEPIEMYACWPYRLAGVIKPDTLQLARDTWETIPDTRAKCKQDYSWMANVANMAALAWTEEAAKRVINKMANTAAPQARFPAFFGPGHDWLPDHNWGGSGMTGLQEMILAPEPGPTGKLNLFPAWPVEWDVDFKLHAPGPTRVEGVLRGGKLVTLTVTPDSRARDIVNWLGKQPASLPKTVATDASRGAHFRKGHYGLFLHWGLYSRLAGQWKGKTYYGIGEWIMNPAMAGIPVAEYMEIAKGFNPDRFDAKTIVQLAKDAGMTYVIITSKHHEGFAMFKSAHPFNIVDASPFARDPMMELAEACRVAGLGFGIYYSHNQDWTAPGGSGGPNQNADGTPATFEQYFRQKCYPQVKELCTQYGPLEVVWFDTPGNMPKESVVELRDLVRATQPNALLGSRIGYDMGDYQTLGDMEVPPEKVGGLWESCDTSNDSWAYAWYDTNWKTPREILKRLVSTVARGGNYLLNCGPDGKGQIPGQCQEFLRAAGAWIHAYPEVIYGAGPSPWNYAMPWGDVTMQGDKTLNLVVSEVPRDGAIHLPGLTTPVKSAVLLGTDKPVPIRPEVAGNGVRLKLPACSAEGLAAVIRVELAGTPKVDQTLALHPNMANMLFCHFAAVTGAVSQQDKWMEKFGEWKHVTQIAQWTADGRVNWTVNVLEPGAYKVSLRYRGAGRLVWKIVTDEGGLIQNQQAATEKYQDYPMGVFLIKTPGLHKIEVSLVDGDRDSAGLEAVTLTRVQ